MASKEIIGLYFNFKNDIDALQQDTQTNNGPNEIARVQGSGLLPNNIIPSQVNTWVGEGTFSGSQPETLINPALDLAVITGNPNIRLWQVDIRMFIYKPTNNQEPIPNTGDRWLTIFPDQDGPERISIYSDPPNNPDATQLVIYRVNGSYNNRNYHIVIKWFDLPPTVII